jgi:predicted lipoprotein
MKLSIPWILGILLVIGFIAVLPFSVTIVPIAEVEAVEAAEEFDAPAFVGGIFDSRVVPTVQEKAVDLAAILDQFAVDERGIAKKDELVPIAEENGVITVGEAHVYMVKGQGVVTEVDTESRVKTMTVQLEGYEGPITVKLYTGPRIPSDETAVRDAVGFPQLWRLPRPDRVRQGRCGDQQTRRQAGAGGIGPSYTGRQTACLQRRAGYAHLQSDRHRPVSDQGCAGPSRDPGVGAWLLNPPR